METYHSRLLPTQIAVTVTVFGGFIISISASQRLERNGQKREASLRAKLEFAVSARKRLIWSAFIVERLNISLLWWKCQANKCWRSRKSGRLSKLTLLNISKYHVCPLMKSSSQLLNICSRWQNNSDSLGSGCVRLMWIPNRTESWDCSECASLTEELFIISTWVFTQFAGFTSFHCNV